MKIRYCISYDSLTVSVIILVRITATSLVFVWLLLTSKFANMMSFETNFVLKNLLMRHKISSYSLAVRCKPIKKFLIRLFS
jgi:hypothetical protein